MAATEDREYASRAASTARRMVTSGTLLPGESARWGPGARNQGHNGITEVAVVPGGGLQPDVMAEMDVVICVDTGGAHLAGVLGRPVWLVLARVAAWGP